MAGTSSSFPIFLEQRAYDGANGADGAVKRAAKESMNELTKEPMTELMKDPMQELTKEFTKDSTKESTKELLNDCFVL